MYSLEIDLVILFLAVSTIGMVGVVIYSHVKNRMKPEERVRAVVIRRTMRDYSLDAPKTSWPMILNALASRRYSDGYVKPALSNKTISRLSGEVTIVESVDYFMTFGVNGEEIEFLVPEGIYMAYEEGTTGTLIFQGEVFKHFMADTKEP